MDNFKIYRPTQFHFGAGLEHEVGNIIKHLGKRRVLVVFGQSHCLSSGLLLSVQKSLFEAGIDFVCHGGVQSNPQADAVYELIKIGKSEQVDFILAVGGGSVIDSAKAAAMGIVNQGDFFDFFLGKAYPKHALALGVILTLPGTGSEGSASAMMQKHVDGRNFKLLFSSNLIVPKFAILNPELTMKASQYLVACGIVNTLTNVLTRYFTNSVEVSLTDRMCESIMLSVVETAPRLIINHHHYGVRSNLMWAATMSNNDWCGVGRVYDWAAHVLACQLSALYGINHGAALSIILPAWMEYTLDHNPMRYAQIAHRIFGVPMNYRHPLDTAEDGILALRNFFSRLNLPLSFDDIDAKADDIIKILRVLETVESINKQAVGNFVHLNLGDCETIFNNAARYKHPISKAALCQMTLHNYVPFSHPYEEEEYEDY